MIDYKNELEFKKIIVSKALFPGDKASAKIFFLFHTFILVSLFLLPIAVLFGDFVAVFKDVASDQIQAMSLIVLYYIGSLSLIGMMIAKAHKY
ncbi:hypothetical protein F9L33_03530 [Amylibacter sp. SFDW26]|uniref:hypothetical protein n=1 Tax=Amylibacter sp. SFDW26 TaxID=2652722 RepID=UPI001261B1A2|nr:hypothetical protein [Amylibacter sp. SFDW26]KAB7615843.1 hypothetical protein F9L33_03530 [Amylibacter sp. SFDW26]